VAVSCWLLAFINPPRLRVRIFSFVFAPFRGIGVRVKIVGATLGYAIGSNKEEKRNAET
jgi:hypothetical protein